MANVKTNVKTIRFLAIILVVCLLALSLAACGQNAADSDKATRSGNVEMNDSQGSGGQGPGSNTQGTDEEIQSVLAETAGSFEQSPIQMIQPALACPTASLSLRTMMRIPSILW